MTYGSKDVALTHRVPPPHQLEDRKRHQVRVVRTSAPRPRQRFRSFRSLPVTSLLGRAAGRLFLFSSLLCKQSALVSEVQAADHDLRERLDHDSSPNGGLPSQNESDQHKLRQGNVMNAVGVSFVPCFFGW